MLKKEEKGFFHNEKSSNPVALLKNEELVKKLEEKKMTVPFEKDTSVTLVPLPGLSFLPQMAPDTHLLKGKGGDVSKGVNATSEAREGSLGLGAHEDIKQEVYSLHRLLQHKLTETQASKESKAIFYPLDFQVRYKSKLVHRGGQKWYAEPLVNRQDWQSLLCLLKNFQQSQFLPLDFFSSAVAVSTPTVSALLPPPPLLSLVMDRPWEQMNKMQIMHEEDKNAQKQEPRMSNTITTKTTKNDKDLSDVTSHRLFIT